MIKKWYEFIKESTFLKKIDHLGFIYLKFYDKAEVLNILIKHNDNDYLIDKDMLVYNFDNSELEDSLNILTFKKEVESTFSLDFLKSASRTPIELKFTKQQEIYQKNLI